MVTDCMVVCEAKTVANMLKRRMYDLKEQGKLIIVNKAQNSL